MDTILFYTIWMTITTIWSAASNDNSKEMRQRYIFTFVLWTITYYYAFVFNQ